MHTFELSKKPTKDEWKQCKDALYTAQKNSGGNWIYPDSQCEGHHTCTRYAAQGIRIRLEHVQNREESKGRYIRTIYRSAFHWMEEHDMQTDDLMKKFEKLVVNPVSLRKGYHASHMPRLSEILRTVDEWAISIKLTYWK